MTGYSAALTYYNRNRFPSASLGLTGEYSDRERSMRVDRVEPGGPAARVGLTAGDRIVAVNGRPLETIYRYWDAVDRGRPGETVRLTVQRQVDSRLDDVALELGAFHLPGELEGMKLTLTQLLALNLLSLYPLPFLVVAGIVLTQRYDDRNAWLLSLMFGAFIAGVDLPNFISVVHPMLRKPLLAYWALLAAVPPGALYGFFTLFPKPTVLDRRMPWLKVVLLGLPLAVGTVLAVVTLVTPGRPFYLSTELRTPGLERAFGYTMGAYSLAGYGLGLVSLILNSFVADPETRKRTRVLLWGTAGALVPLIIVGTYAEAHDLEFIELPFWVWVGAIMAVLLLPLSFAYAVAKHRVMEIPVLLRRSARYLVVHHAIIVFGIVIGVTLTIVFAWALSRVLPPPLAATVWAERLSGVAGAVFGVIVALAMRRVVREGNRAARSGVFPRRVRRASPVAGSGTSDQQRDRSERACDPARRAR